MRTSTLLWIILIVVIVAVAVWAFIVAQSMQPASYGPANAGYGTSSTTPFGSASSTGTVTDSSSSTATSGQEIVPGSTAAPIVGSNLMLGTNQNSKLGTFLSGYTGMTLYAFAKDQSGTSTCYAACAQMWPPYVVSPSDTYNFEYGVNGADVGTITRADGSLQLTYNGHPLYFYSGDKSPNSYSGQGVQGAWYVVAP